MLEWQPARFREAHPEDIPLLKALGLVRGDTAIESNIFRIRETEVLEDVLYLYRQRGCNSNRFFQIHPNDADRLSHKQFSTGTVTVWFVCEHEVLTD